MMDGSINDISENIERGIKEKVIANKLFDEESPNLITNLKRDEIENFAKVKALIDAENIERYNLGIPPNLMTEMLHNNLVFRCSLDGWRANQGEKILTNAKEEEEINENNKISRILGVKR